MPETLLDEALVETIRVAICEGKAKWTAGKGFTSGDLDAHLRMPSNQYLAETVAAALASLQPSVSEMGWQPIDTAPKEGPDILALWTCRVTGERVISADVSWRRDVWVSEGEGLIDPTHWMPLPNPPALSPEGEP